MNYALIILMLLKLGLTQKVSNTNDDVKEILEFLRQGEEQIKSTVHKDIIFVLGPTGSGKSALVHLLAGNPSFLRSISSDEDSDDFIIEHLFEDKIGNVTFQSKTIFPELVIDENNVPYYDCPGFSDTRTTSIEIATTYFTKKVISNTDRLKIVFVVNFNSMMRGTSSRNDFAEFVQHATEFLKNVKFYKVAIMLVASKVPGQAGHVGGDEKLMKKVRSFLKEYRQFLVEESVQNDSKSNGFILNKLDLIDIFLTNGRIILFKRPNIPGLLSQIPEMMENRQELRISIKDKINFVNKNEDDFGYTLSDRSKLKINELAEEINLKITNLFGQINRTVIEHYSNKHVDFNDIADLQNELDKVIKTLSKISDSSAESSSVLAVNRLNIPDLQRILMDFDHHIDYIKFLENVHDAPITRRTSDWVGALRSCMEYLAKEKNWYLFADTLLHRLSEYDVQRNVSKYDVADVERWGLGTNSTAASGILITPENFKNFLKKIMAFEMAKDAVAAKSKITLLNGILNATVKSRPTTYTCHRDKVTVKGNFVKFSDLKNYQTFCDHGVQLVEVFGLSTIFFDSDFKGNVDLVVIAPKWIVVHDHVRIALDGANGTDGTDASSKNIFHGNPGKHGDDGHHFFGYSDHPVNVGSLYITTVGGNGGRGGNGYDSIDGRSVTIPADGSNGEELRHYAKVVKQTDESDPGFLYFNRKKWQHETFETYAHCPSINGIGGSGGFGGYGGTIQTNGMSGIKILIKDGEDGSHGLPGKCGKIYDKMELFKTESTSCLFWIFCTSKTSWRARKFSDATCIKNCRSSSLLNVNGILKSKAKKPSNFALSVDQYKSFARENLHRMPMSSKFATNFLRSMEQNSKIRAAYDTESFIDDFYQIEKQFHRLNNEQNSMIYFYQSLNQRILEYASNPLNKLQTSERRILANLYTAGLSKICKMRSGTEQNLIIDIESYLDVAIDHISLLEKSGKRMVIDQFKNEYRRNMESRIVDNHDLITMHILPAIEQLSSRTDSVIENLLAKIIEEKNSIASSNDRYDKMRRKLKESLIPRGILNFVKIVADVAGLFTGFGSAVSRTLNTINRVASAFTNEHVDKIQIPSEKISYSTAYESEGNQKLENSARFSQNRKLNSFLTLVNEVLEMAMRFSFDDILEPVKVVKNKLIGDKRVDLNSDEIDLLQNDVQSIIAGKAAKVKAHFRNETNSLRALDKIQKKLSVLRMDVEIFNKFSSNDQKLREIESVMGDTQTNLLELNNLQQTLQLSILPVTQQMRTLLNRFQMNRNEDTIPSLDGALKWDIQNILKDVRYQMRRIGTLDWKLNGELLHVFDKLDGAISTLSNIFDQMQIYEDQLRLSNYIANIESADYKFETSSSIQQSKNLNHLNRLNGIIESNVLLTIFGNALNGFKQTVFPFAEFYLRRFNLPPELETETNLKTLVTKAIEELVNLKLTLKEYHSASINANDNLIYTADFSSDFTSSNPFYVWSSDEHRDMIVQLMSGKNITVKVDITKGPKLNAIKFQYLQIHLKSSNKTNQDKLDKFLENFDVTIIHHGNSYYRCDDKFYLITSRTLRINYSFEKDSNGQPIRKNNVHHKMRNGDFVLSPFALLTISLTARHPEQFMLFNSDFGQNINLELRGRGQYLNPNVDACFGLEKYYAADEVLIS